MDSTEKKVKNGGAGNSKKKVPVSFSMKTGLQFSVNRVGRNFQSGRYAAKYISPSAAVYLTGVLEYLVTEVLESAGNLAREKWNKKNKRKKKMKIESQHLVIAAQNDEQLGKLLAGITIDQESDIDFLTNGLNKIVLRDDGLIDQGFDIDFLSLGLKQVDLGSIQINK